MTITSPTNGARFLAPASLTIAASASESGGSIARVQFYAGTNLVDTDLFVPYGRGLTRRRNASG